MKKLMKAAADNSISSLEVLEQINLFRKEEGSSVKLGHNDLLKIIRDEFDEEISLGKISQSNYTNERGREYPMYELTLNEAKQILLRESKYVRRAVIEYIEKLEAHIKNELLLKEKFENARIIGKGYRKEFTDAIKIYVAYCQESGSSNANYYYINLTNFLNKLVGCNSREEANFKQVNKLMYFESSLSNVILFNISQGVYYKDIFKKCKHYCEQIDAINKKTLSTANI